MWSLNDPALQVCIVNQKCRGRSGLLLPAQCTHQQNMDLARSQFRAQRHPQLVGHITSLGSLDLLSAKVELYLPLHFTRLLGREDERIHTTTNSKLLQGADVLCAALTALQIWTHWILHNKPVRETPLFPHFTDGGSEAERLRDLPASEQNCSLKLANLIGLYT